MPSGNIRYNKDKSDELNFSQNTNKYKNLEGQEESIFNQHIPAIPCTLNKAADRRFEISRARRVGSFSEGGPHLGATCSPRCCMVGMGEHKNHSKQTGTIKEKLCTTPGVPREPVARPTKPSLDAKELQQHQVVRTAR